MSHWSGLRPLVSATISILNPQRTALGYPVVSLCHGDHAALDLQDLPLHMPQQCIDVVDVEVNQLKVVDLGLDDSLVVQLSSSSSPRF